MADSVELSEEAADMLINADIRVRGRVGVGDHIEELRSRGLVGKGDCLTRRGAILAVKLYNAYWEPIS